MGAIQCFVHVYGPPISHRKNKMQKSAGVMQLRPVSYIWLSSVTEWLPIEK